MSPLNTEYHTGADSAAALEARGLTVPLVPSRERLQITDVCMEKCGRRAITAKAEK